MKSFLEKIKADHLVFFLLTAMLVVPLCLPSVREAHVLCARWFLHLKGETYVRGNQPGNDIDIVPSVQFTKWKRQILRSRSTNSLEDFELAFATGDGMKLQFPQASYSLTNHPLLQWAALTSAYLAYNQDSTLNPTNRPATNAISAAAVKNALQFIRLAQTANATNGALWIAEAALYFTDKRDSEALAALQIAATNRVWLTGAEESFASISELLQRNGLSELDAANQANTELGDLFFLELQGKCARGLWQMLTASVEENDKKQFAELLKLSFDLRRANCPDQDNWNYNVFRRFNVGFDLGNAMAKKLGKIPIPDSANIPWPYRQKVWNQYFEEYALLCAEPRLTGSYITQNENYETERILRSEIRGIRGISLQRRTLCSAAAGVFALFGLSGVLGTIMFEMAVLYLRKHPNQPGEIANTRQFWTVAVIGTIVGTIVFANGWIGSGIMNENLFDATDPPPLISANVAAVLVCLLVWSVMFGASYFEWRKGKLVGTHWRLTMIAGFAYVISIVLMALFRFGTVQILTPGHF